MTELDNPLLQDASRHECCSPYRIKDDAPSRKENLFICLDGVCLIPACELDASCDEVSVRSLFGHDTVYTCSVENLKIGSAPIGDIVGLEYFRNGVG